MLAVRPRVQAQARAKSIPAPVAGWNARDSIANMGPEYAVILNNLFPRNTFCELRHGYIKWATGFTGTAETIFAYSGGTTDKLFCAVGADIFDITAQGAVGAAAVSSLTNARWQYVNNTTTGGNYLQAVNGSDKMIVFDGTSWHADGDGAPYNVTGVNTSDVIGITLSHNRVWLCPKGSLKAYYLPAGQIGGAVSTLDLSSFARLGGYLMTIATWTMDAGFGMDDMTVFITSNGEIIVYSGADPASPSTWSLIGIYQVGSPIGRRCAVKYKGDLMLLTQDGIQPMSAALQSSRLDPRVSITNTIQLAISQAISASGSNFGWSMLLFSKENMLIVNIPIAGSQPVQYVMNTITQAWCSFSGWYASCWELFQDNPYFGANGYVGRAWQNMSDDGGIIGFDGLQAFSYFGSPGINKLFTQLGFVLSLDGSPSLGGKVNLDFDTSSPTSSVFTSIAQSGIWNSIDPATGFWGQALWGGGTVLQTRWQGAYGMGKAGAPHLAGNCLGMSLQWMASNIIYIPGGML